VETRPQGSLSTLVAHQPSNPPVERLATSAYMIPTETPESDGTLEWSQTTSVIAEVGAGAALGTLTLALSRKRV
jgi:hypothetical protein